MFDLRMIQQSVYLHLLQWRIRLRNWPPGSFLGVSIVVVVLCILAWRHFGTDTALPVLADATPILLAVVGIVMSYKQPRKESHRTTTFILIVAGLLGSAVLSVNRIRSESSHKKEMTDLIAKMDTVRDQNTKLTNFLLTTKSLGEVDRRHAIVATLRNEYILSHDPIDPEILAGAAMPPEEWMNKRLHDLGELWRVSDSSSTSGSSGLASKTYLVFTKVPIFTGPNAAGTEGSDFQPGSPLGFNLHYSAVGPNPIQLLDQASEALLEPDSSSATQNAMVSGFKAEIEREKKLSLFKNKVISDSSRTTISQGQDLFFTAFGLEPVIDFPAGGVADENRARRGGI